MKMQYRKFLRAVSPYSNGPLVVKKFLAIPYQSSSASPVAKPIKSSNYANDRLV